MCTLTARLMRARKRMGCRLSKSIIQTEKECYICRRWYAVKTTRGLEEHYNVTCAQTLKAVAQAKYEEKNGPGAHAAWMAAVGKDYINA